MVEGDLSIGQVTLRLVEEIGTTIKGTTKRLQPGLVNFVTAVAYPFLSELTSSIEETWPKPFRGAL